MEQKGSTNKRPIHSALGVLGFVQQTCNNGGESLAQMPDVVGSIALKRTPQRRPGVPSRRGGIDSLHDGLPARPPGHALLGERLPGKRLCQVLGPILLTIPQDSIQAGTRLTDSHREKEADVGGDTSPIRGTGNR